MTASRARRPPPDPAIVAAVGAALDALPPAFVAMAERDPGLRGWREPIADVLVAAASEAARARRAGVDPLDVPGLDLALRFPLLSRALARLEAIDDGGRGLDPLSGHPHAALLRGVREEPGSGALVRCVDYLACLAGDDAHPLAPLVALLGSLLVLVWGMAAQPGDGPERFARLRAWARDTFAARIETTRAAPGGPTFADLAALLAGLPADPFSLRAVQRQVAELGLLAGD